MKHEKTGRLHRGLYYFCIPSGIFEKLLLSWQDRQDGQPFTHMDQFHHGQYRYKKWQDCQMLKGN